MSLLTDWRDKAYATDADPKQLNALWEDYFAREKKIYKQLLADPDTEVKGTVKELAEKYDMTIELMIGFLDGIDDSLVICAHDYSKKFSRLSSLQDGSELFFTNVNGEVYRYVIRSHRRVNDEDIGKLTDGAAFDVALVTCNMGGQAGYAAWCVRAEDD